MSPRSRPSEVRRTRVRHSPDDLILLLPQPSENDRDFRSPFVAVQGISREGKAWSQLSNGTPLALRGALERFRRKSKVRL